MDMVPATVRPLSFQEVVEAVNKIRDYVDARIKLRTSDEGLAHIHIPTQGGTFDLLVNSVDTHSVRGFSHSKSYLLAREVSAPAIIRFQFSVPIRQGQYSTIFTHMEYLLVNRGDDPVLLFLNVLRDFLDSQKSQLLEPTSASMTRLLSEAML
jgi:hypothetical protein